MRVPRRIAPHANGQKNCTHCEGYFPLSDFYTTGKRVNGEPKYNSWCKLCIKEKQASYHKLTWGEEALQRSAYKRTRTVEAYLSYLLQKARKRDWCEIDVSDVVRVWNLQNGKCALTGWEMTRILGQGVIPTNASIDRIDSSKYYSKNNIQLVCRCVNTAKSDLSVKEFIDLCKAVTEKYYAENSSLAA